MEEKDLEEWVEKMKDNWEEIGKLENGDHILCNIKTGRILIEDSTKHIREPHHPEEWKKISKVINKNFEKWKMILRLIENKI